MPSPHPWNCKDISAHLPYQQFSRCNLKSADFRATIPSQLLALAHNAAGWQNASCWHTGCLGGKEERILNLLVIHDICSGLVSLGSLVLSSYEEKNNLFHAVRILPSELELSYFCQAEVLNFGFGFIFFLSAIASLLRCGHCYSVWRLNYVCNFCVSLCPLPQCYLSLSTSPIKEVGARWGLVSSPADKTRGNGKFLTKRGVKHWHCPGRWWNHHPWRDFKDLAL